MLQFSEPAAADGMCLVLAGVLDTETGLYYLQSRYYDPEVGRFINADAFATTGQCLLGNNMFAYCNNNPPNLKDSGGYIPIPAGIADPRASLHDSGAYQGGIIPDVVREAENQDQNGSSFSLISASESVHAGTKEVSILCGEFDWISVSPGEFMLLNLDITVEIAQGTVLCVGTEPSCCDKKAAMQYVKTSPKAEAGKA